MLEKSFEHYACVFLYESISVPAWHKTFFCSVVFRITQLSLCIFIFNFLSSTNAILLFLSREVPLGSCLWLCLGIMLFLVLIFIWINLSKVNLLPFFCFILLWLICGQSCSNTFVHLAGSPNWLICGQSCSKTFFLLAGSPDWLICGQSCSSTLFHLADSLFLLLLHPF